MVAGTGGVTITNLKSVTMEYVAAENLIIDGTTVTIPHSYPLDSNTQYEVSIPPTVLSSTDGLDFAGLGAGE
ncbi:MAG: hypothetical protein HRT71_12555 [Flavobacteriales bacterium]|nr:hypothetical protein [Flavobacteriales bacterium]